MPVTQRERLERQIAALLEQLKALEVRGRGSRVRTDPVAEAIFKQLTAARRDLHDLHPE
ncbi:MAG: hypothetical protein NVSMB25_24980 [Thermoleophilaceae bacterium]